jgi:hypothetical protein
MNPTSTHPLRDADEPRARHGDPAPAAAATTPCEPPLWLGCESVHPLTWVPDVDAVPPAAAP